uniref:SFRICE_006073 n=1 Tax=Spodoptera frugiperda TaxID=7108 RepID=A0A2H1WIW1_SPOFR
MYKIYTRSNNYFSSKQYNLANPLFGGLSNINVQDTNRIHVTTSLKFPPAAALKLPTNVVDINASEVGRFSPLRERDISGPVISSCYKKQIDLGKIDITVQSDPHVNKYDCRGAVSLSSSMQSNVPSPFSGNHTHLNMPGSQWGQGYKYLSDHLHGAHYLTLRNEYRSRMTKDAVGIRNMSTDSKPPMSAKEKLKQAIKEYGSTVIVFHVGISLISLGSCYLLISSGIDLVAVLKYLNISEGTILKAAGSNAGTFVIAYTVHKFFAPFRIAITLTATPFIVRYLRNVGFLKRSVNTGGGK